MSEETCIAVILVGALFTVCGVLGMPPLFVGILGLALVLRGWFSWKSQPPGKGADSQ